MSFLYPTFLFGLFAIAIPIVIHLFSFRKYKKIHFSNTKFLAQITQQTQSKNNLKHLLILLTRILAITFLVIAFAQPFIPLNNQVSNQNKENVISIYIDNSFSMNAENEEGNLLAQAKKASQNIVMAYNQSDRFLIATNSSINNYFVNREQAIQLIDEIEDNAKTENLSSIFIKIKDLHKEKQSEKRNKIYLISDFQKSTTDLENFKTDSIDDITLIPLQANETKNLYIDSCWFDTPYRQKDKQEKLWVRIKNNSNENYENLPLNLTVNGIAKAVASFSIDANNVVDTPIYFNVNNTGFHLCELSITDFPVTFDDKLFFSFDVSQSINVVHLYQEKNTGFVDKIFSVEPYFSYFNYEIKNIDFNQLKYANTIILNEVYDFSSGLVASIKDFIEKGGNLIIIPNNNKIGNINELSIQINAPTFGEKSNIKNRVRIIEKENSIIKNVFEKIPNNISLPEVNSYYAISKQNALPILSFDNQQKLLTQSNFENGNVFTFSASLNNENSNFYKHTICLPIFYNIAFQSIKSNKLFYTVGHDEVIEILNPNISFIENTSITNEKNTFEFVPEIKTKNNKTLLYLHQNIKTADNYFILNKNKKTSSFSFNFNRLESNLSFLSIESINNIISENNLSSITVLQSKTDLITEKIKQTKQGKSLWFYFIILTLIFVTTEVLLIRFWKNS